LSALEFSRRQALALAAIGLVGPVDAWAGERLPLPQGARGFDFLFGRWRVAHRSLTGTGSWQESRGTCTNRPVMGGLGNIEEHLIEPASGPFRAGAIRCFDPGQRRWLIWWLDARAPDRIEAPMTGGFDGGVGRFTGETDLNGRATPMRFLWTGTETGRPHWEQAISNDGGRSWQPVWSMDFERIG